MKDLPAPQSQAQMLCLDRKDFCEKALKQQIFTRAQPGRFRKKEIRARDFKIAHL